MMIFGPGRHSPAILMYWKEMAAAQNNDVVRFDKLLFKHIDSVGNTVRSFWLGLTISNEPCANRRHENVMPA